MIDRKFVHFKHKEDFQKQQHNIRPDSLVFVQDSSEIVANNIVYPFVSWDIILPIGYCNLVTSEGLSLVDSAGVEFIILKDDI